MSEGLQNEEKGRHSSWQDRPAIVHVTTGINPLVPRVQKIKIRNFTLNRLIVVEFVKKMVYLGAHYSERQGLKG